MTCVSPGKILIGVATFVVVVAVASAIVQNPPSLQRARRFDEMRVQDLNQLQMKVEAYHRQHKALPGDLASVCPRCAADFVDPATHTPYGYEKTGEADYKLCAVFATSTQEQRPRSTFKSYWSEWVHDVGQTCFERHVTLPEKAGN